MVHFVTVVSCVTRSVNVAPFMLGWVVIIINLFPRSLDATRLRLVSLAGRLAILPPPPVTCFLVLITAVATSLLTLCTRPPRLNLFLRWLSRPRVLISELLTLTALLSE